MDTGAEFDRYTPQQLSELYQRDPDRFDALAGAAIERACIGKTPRETTRLRQTQWLIDGQLRKARSPLQRLQMMEQIFYGRVFGDDGELSRLAHTWQEVLVGLRRIEQLRLSATLGMLKSCKRPDRRGVLAPHRPALPSKGPESS